jgi:GPI mannosyltransferase 2
VLFISERSAGVLAAVLLNLVASAVAAEFLFALSVLALRSHRLAWIATCWFCLSPAGVFFAATYTEGSVSLQQLTQGAELGPLTRTTASVSFHSINSLCHCRIFAAFSFAGMYLCTLSAVRSHGDAVAVVGAAICFLFGGATRSNGILSVMFLVWAVACALRTGPLTNQTAKIWRWLFWIPLLLACSCLVCLPYFVFQWFGYFTYCASPPYWLHNLAGVAGIPFPAAPTYPLRPWCSAASFVPSMYAFVQSEYWGVGLFKYFQLKQIPQFLLAAPMLILASVAASLYFKLYFDVIVGEARELLLAITLFPVTGSASASATSSQSASLSIQARDAHATSISGRAWGRTHAEENRMRVVQKTVLPFVAQWLGLSLIGVCFMHVQVVTRFVSSCPALYWFLGTVTESRFQLPVLGWLGCQWPAGHGRMPGPVTVPVPVHAVLLSYSVGFMLVGSTLVGGFYNWT